MVQTTFNLVFMTDPKVIGHRFEFKNQPPKKLVVIIYAVYNIFLFMTDPMTHDSRPSFIQRVHASQVYI